MTTCDDNNKEFIEKDLRYLKLLAKQFPTISKASSEIINLQSILNLPKGTEHFISDIHGEYESFTHMLKNASGVIKRKINDAFGNTLRESEKATLATLIYYPEQKLELIRQTEENIKDWYKITLYRLIEFCRRVSSKYTRSKVRKNLPDDFAYIIEELLHEQSEMVNKHEYYSGIIDSIIEIDRAGEFIVAISKVIQRLVVDRLHIVGDIYDRGPGADIIMDALMSHHSLDIEWGNHDTLWMGAACGSMACIANVLRISLRYANLRIIEDGYGINLLPLATFAMESYADDPCTNFKPRTIDKELSERELSLLSKMHKAISIIQLKIEGSIIKNHPEFDMEDRLLLDKMNIDEGIIEMNDKTYKLNDTSFPTLNDKNPYKLTQEEEEIMNKLKKSFLHSEKLQKHIEFMYAKGSMYLKYNSNLLYHGCIPLNEDGSFKEVILCGKKYRGKSLLDRYDHFVRDAYFAEDLSVKIYAMDMMWYLWCGADSPLFGKQRMATFERYFIEDKSTHIEERIPYYRYRDNEGVCINILKEFGLNPDTSHIINGHIPVKSKSGESPIKSGGKLIVIDGGFSKAYQPETGIAGYTLIYNSYGLQLTSHEPFSSIKKAIAEDTDIISSTIILEHVLERQRVKDTDIGEELTKQIKDLKMLLKAYRKGLIQ